MTTIRICEFYVGLNGQCVEVVKSLQPDGGGGRKYGTGIGRTRTAGKV